jgi:hypothetical protein
LAGAVDAVADFSEGLQAAIPNNIITNKKADKKWKPR